MIWLACGVGLFAAAHLLPALDLPLRQRSIERFGPDAHRGLFSLVVVAAVGLIVLGWRSAEPAFAYAPPAWGRDAANYAMVVALWLFVVSGAPSNVKRVLRHPQLLSVVIWSAAHLLANGDGRSILLFGGLAAWALAMMPILNRRDGAWTKPDAVPPSRDLVVAAIAVAVFFGVRFAHPWIAGVPASY